MTTQTVSFRLLSLLCAAVLLAGCSDVYYKAAESVGYSKREIMLDRVENAQEAQSDAQEQFLTAFDRFRSIVEFDGGNLEALYDDLNGEFEQSQEAADTVHERIAAVKDVSAALFEEWQQELALYTNPTLKASSARKLKETRLRYAQMIDGMEKAERRMQPVLNAFQDQVLFLKHNLNAQAIASLKGEFASLKADIDGLMADMQQAIARSNAFVEQLK